MLTYNNGRVVIHRITKNNEIKTISTEEIRKNNQYNEQLTQLPQNDTGNAKRFLLFCRDFVKYNTTQQAWFLWNGKVWSSDNSYNEIIKLAQAVMDKYYIAAKESLKLEESVKKSIMNHAKTSNNYSNLCNMLTLVSFMNYVKEFKSKPYFLNVQNGVVDLRTKKLYPHRPEYGCTNICICDYDPKAKSTRFKSFVEEITDYNDELYDYLKTSAGYWATGLRREEKFFLCKGSGANGKSKWLETLEYTLGDYACQFPTNALTKSNTDASRPTPELVPLVNVRFAHASELEAKNIINDACIKQYTGNSHLLVRKMRQEYTKISIEFKVVIDTNFEPKFKRFDYAIKRRLVIIPFTKTFAKDKDLTLESKLQSDCQYVLKWIIDGAYNYYKNGLHEPSIVRTATEEYSRNSDSVQSFIDNATVPEKESLVKSSIIHQAYVSYCQSNSYEPMDIKVFSQSLSQKGFEKKQKNQGAFFKGLRII